ncbi:MAG: hypothetical protein M1829_002045 [Trizodia sp. TS-e1964]|nr:MAG: hypothetical protein M1829_002045 [Trizodia sp. TS-e1964]
MASKATLLKEEGNRFFAQKDFKSAERLYTEAIARETSDPTLFTNRAFARLELKAWEDVITDCLSALELSPNNMKAFYYLAQAQIHLNHPNEALVSALTAYEYSLRNNSPSTGKISALVLKAKKEKWAARENERLARKGDLLAETEEGLRALARGDTLRRQQLMAQGLLSAEAEEQSRINSEKEVGRKIEELRSIFAISNPFKPERRVRMRRVVCE